MPAAVQIALISKQELDKLNKDHVDLKVGDKLKGEVKDVRKDGKATIDFGRFQTDVELKGPVSKGDEVSVVVVEKGKQIKLKLEQIKSRDSAEAPKTAKQADGIRSGEAGELKQKIDSLVQKEIEPPTNRQEFYKSNERLHRDIKNSLTKLQKILQSPTSADAKDLKNLASEIKSVLSSLESYDDALNISDKITKPLAKLDALLKESGIPLNKEVREVLSKIADAASRLGNLKNLDQLPEIKNIIDNELKPNLTRLKKLIRNEAAASSPGNQKTAQEAQKAIEDIIKNLDKALQKLPDKVRAQGSTAAATKSTPQVVRETASPIPESGEVVKQISNLKAMVEKSGIPMDKETTDIIKNLSNAAEKIKNIKSPEQLPELKNIIEKEIKPNLERLKQVMAKEVAKPPTRADAKIRSALTLKSEVDNAIKKLDKAMEKLPESVTRSTRRPDSGEVVKQITDLKTMVEKSGLPMDKETAEALQKLTDAAEKIKQMKSPEQAREVKDIIDKEIKPNLERVKQYIDQTRVKSETQSVSRQNAAAEKIKQAVQSSLHNVRRTSTQPAKSAELVKDIANLKAMVEKSDLPMNKETTAALQKLTDAADKIKQMKTPEQAQEVKNIIEKEIKPNLLRLRQSLDIGTPKTGTANANAGRNSAENIKYAADKLLNQLAQSPDKSQTTQNTEVRDAMKQISALKALAEKSGVPLSREAEALIGKLVETATKISQLQTAQQAEIQTGKMSREISAEIGKLIDKELKPNLNSLKQTMDREIAKAEPAKVSANRKSAAEIKQAVDKLLQNLEKTLEKLPAKMKTSESIETLLNEIKNIRRTLEASSETINTGYKIVKEVSNIKTLVEQAAVPFEKEMEVIITKLAETAQKISQLRDPSQIPEIRAIIDKELKPNLSELRKLINPGNTSTDSTPENNQSAETTKEISQRVEALQKEIAAALEKFPDKAQTSRDTRELLKDISSVLNKISDFSNLPGKEQFAEDLETIFENIKLALKQLQFNTASGKGNPFNIPTEMKESIANLQVNFSLNSAQMKEAVTQQISQLNALIEHLENSGFSADKRVEALMGKLTEIVKQLGEFKNNNQWRQIMNTLQDELKPALKDLKQMFKPADALQASKSDANTGAEAIIREKMAAAAGSVEQMEQLIDGFLEKSSAQTKSAEFLEKSSTIPKEVKNALAKLPESLKSVENLAQLSEKIQMAASKLSSAEQLPMQLLQSESRSTFPPQIKNMLNLLRSHFEPLNIGESALKLAPKLKSLVDDSGLFFEKKIQDAIARVADASARFSGIENLGQLPQIRNIINNDLKPNLAALKDFFNSEQFAADPANKEAYESIKKAVEDLMSNIDNQQNRAMDSQNKQQPMQVFSFQVPIKGEKDAQLKIFYNKGKQKEDEDDFKLSLMLDMDKLGELRTDFTHWENNLTITLFVKSYEIKGFLEENLETVREVIEPEFNSLTIQTIVSEDKIAEFDSIGQPETEIVSDKAVDVKV